MKPLGISALGLATLAACRGGLGDQPALISEPRLIAVRADPAEVAPGARVTLTAFVATPDGPIDGDADWALCNEPKPVGENGTVSPDCFGDLSSAGHGATVTVVVPSDACTRFGPQSPPQTGPTPVRPRDPDRTGGFYQPVRAVLDGHPSIALVRIHCPLAQAPLDVARAFQQTYVNNVNPTIDDVTADGDTVGGTIDTGSREGFPRFDIASQTLVDATESLSVTWYATAPLSAITDEAATIAPGAPGTVHVWMVLRDDRGGVDVHELDVDP